MDTRDNVFDPVEYIIVLPSPLPSPDRRYSMFNVYKTAIFG